MVDQLIREGFRPIPEEFAALKNAEALDLVLKRLGRALSTHRRTELTAFLEGQALGNSDVGVLAYVLKNLLEVYDKQRPLEQQIRTFVHVANGYLIGKSLHFDEVRAELSLTR